MHRLDERVLILRSFIQYFDGSFRISENGEIVGVNVYAFCIYLIIFYSLYITEQRSSGYSTGRGIIVCYNSISNWLGKSRPNVNKSSASRIDVILEYDFKYFTVGIFFVGYYKLILKEFQTNSIEDTFTYKKDYVLLY